MQLLINPDQRFMEDGAEQATEAFCTSTGPQPSTGPQCSHALAGAKCLSFTCKNIVLESGF